MQQCGIIHEKEVLLFWRYQLRCRGIFSFCESRAPFAGQRAPRGSGSDRGGAELEAPTSMAKVVPSAVGWDVDTMYPLAHVGHAGTRRANLAS